MRGERDFKVVYIVTQSVGLLCVLLVVVWVYAFRGGFAWRSHPSLEFNLHPLLMSFGFIYLSANSILIYRALRRLKKQYLKILHVGIHVGVIACVAVALLAAFDAHNFSIPQKNNLYSAHSWLGILTVSLYLLQFVIGILMYYYPGAPFTIRIKSMSYHIFFGLVVLIATAITAFTGFSEKAIFSLKDTYQEFPFEGVLVNLIAIFHLVFTCLVVFLVTKEEYQRRPSPDDGVSIKAYPLGIFCVRNC